MKLFLSIVLMLGLSSMASAATRYRGFTIDESGIGKAENLAAVRAAICEQIDMVCAVSVPAPMLEFFRGVKFEVVPAGTVRSPTPGLYSARDKCVRVMASIVNIGHKPVLLHELLHALHDQRLERGYGNRAIAGLYEKGKAAGVFVAKSHMMANDKEYFACAGTTYLFGVTAQEPFQRDRVAQLQPALFAFLNELFGPQAGSYAGSLERSPKPAETK